MLFRSKKLGVDFDKLEKVSASEVGNIFPLGTKYSELLNYRFVDEDNSQGLVWMGSYGIGISRLMGVISEKMSDGKGLVWPESVAPYKFHIVVLQQDKNLQKALDVYNKLGTDNCLLDDRDVSNGQKFADADLIGCPVQVVISDKTLAEDSVEIISRDGSKPTKLLKLNELGKI